MALFRNQKRMFKTLLIIFKIKKKDIKKKTFQEEYMEFLEAFEIDYDERYIF